MNIILLILLCKFALLVQEDSDSLMKVSSSQAMNTPWTKFRHIFQVFHHRNMTCFEGCCNGIILELP